MALVLDCLLVLACSSIGIGGADSAKDIRSRIWIFFFASREETGLGPGAAMSVLVAGTRPAKSRQDVLPTRHPSPSSPISVALREPELANAKSRSCDCRPTIRLKPKPNEAAARRTARATRRATRDGVGDCRTVGSKPHGS